MSTKDQLLSVALHGTAMRYAAERRNLAEAITELREIANGRLTPGQVTEFGFQGTGSGSGMTPTCTAS